MREKPFVGMRVDVLSADGKEDLGRGTIEEVMPLLEEETGLICLEAYPSWIALDTGEMRKGIRCWWTPMGEERIETK